MSEQDGRQSSTQQHRSRKTSTAHKQNGKQARAVQRPANDDTEAWNVYWEQQGQPWRTEPEIDEDRQKYLAERRSTTPDIVKGIYSFKDVKLSRADVEWLLATHENGRGPVDWNDPQQRGRFGLDLRGADLSKEDLHGLPLACLLGGLLRDERPGTTPKQRQMAQIHLEQADLDRVHLEGATLSRALMQMTDLYEAHLEEADLFMARLDGALLQAAHLEKAYLKRANLQKANLTRAHLEGAQLSKVSFTSQTILENVTLGCERFGFASLADVDWNGVNLAAIQWSQVKMLGDEQRVRGKMHEGNMESKERLSDEFESAVRANRQLAVTLQIQGLNEVAARFAYRAQRLQRIVLRRQHKIGPYLFSGFLDLIAGYGYKPGQSVLWYLGMISFFALVYHLFGGLSLYPPDAFVYSLTSFHGRGFFPGLTAKPSLHDPLILLAALEAVIGLFIEISFIATFTQRFFGK